MIKKIMEVMNNIELFIEFFNNISDLVYLSKVREDGTFEYMLVNDSAKMFSGIKEDYIGRTVEEVLDEETAGFVIRKYKKAIEQQGSYSYEHHIKNDIPSSSDMHYNSFIFFETTVTPIFNNDCHCTHILAIARDVTDRKRKDKEIEVVKERFELIWNSTADAVYTINKEEHFTQVNQSFTNLLGWTEEELLNNPGITIIPDDYREDIKEVVMRLKNGESMTAHNVQRIRKDGMLVDVLASYSPILDDHGEFNGAVVIYKDVTEQQKYQEKLIESEEKYRLIAEHSSDLIKVIDLEGTVLYASPSHKHILDIEPDYYLHRSLKTFLHQEDMFKVDVLINKIVQTKEASSVEIRAAKKNGEWVWIDSVGTPVFDDDGELVRIITEGRDISERKLYEEKLRKLALYDHLTGLPNRTLFIAELKEAMEDARRTQSKVGVMFMDLDKFKWVNDTMGHDIGDQLLVQFAQRVKECLREEDVLARFAGDEFLLFIPDLEKEDHIYPIAQRIIDSLQEEWEIDEHVFTTTSSIGIAFYPPYEQNYNDVLKYADEALYEAKQQGRNHFQIYKVKEFDEKGSICL
jgi:diguanylate cyclase (GGDEF)-like protein/PAS domain S-box-containing protein